GELLAAAKEMQANAKMPPGVSIERSMLAVLWSVAIAGLLLGVHILLSLWLVRRYASYFCR
nr:hypothetical protein [Chitinophagaceae bacterium]